MTSRLLELYLDIPTHEMLKKKAREEGLTVSQFVVKLIKTDLKEKYSGTKV